MRLTKNLLIIFLAMFVAIGATGCGNDPESKNGSETKVSDELFDYQVSLDGEVYTLPLEYSKLEADGWKTKEDLTRTLEPTQYSIGMVFSKGDKDISLELVNNSEAPKSMKECQVGGIDTSPAESKNLPELSLAKGIKIGSTKEEVAKAYGDPTQQSEDPNAYTYIDKNYAMVQFTFNKEDSTVENILVRNLDIAE